MLYNVPAIINHELLWILASMGHGDDLVIVDRNFPAKSVSLHTQTQRLVHMDGVNVAEAASAILTLLPLDTWVLAPVIRIEVVDEPSRLLPVHDEMIEAVRKAEPRAQVGSLERFAFYEAAKRSYAVVQTTEDRPYGCFILKKGVVFPSGIGMGGE